MSGVRIIYSRQKRESVGADVNLTWNPMATIVTAYNNPITLAAANSSGALKRIYNDSGGNITIESDINVQGAATDEIVLANGAWIELLYINSSTTTERWRDSDGSVSGITLQ